MNPAGNRTQERKKELLSSLALSNFDEETYVSKLENELLAKLPKGELNPFVVRVRGAARRRTTASSASVVCLTHPQAGWTAAAGRWGR